MQSGAHETHNQKNLVILLLRPPVVIAFWINCETDSTQVGDDDPDKIECIRNDINQVKDIMVSNIDTLLERGERLDLLVDKTENLSSQAVTFKQTTTQIRRKMWWQNTKFTIALIAVVVAVIYAIITASCGGFAWPKCVGNGK